MCISTIACTHLHLTQQQTVCHFVFTFTFRAFIRCYCPKRITVIHTFIHWWQVLSCKVPHQEQFGTCQRTLWHADKGNRTSNLMITWHWLSLYIIWHSFAALVANQLSLTWINIQFDDRNLVWKVIHRLKMFVSKVFPSSYSNYSTTDHISRCVTVSDW